MSRSANVTSRPNPPETTRPVTCGLQLSIPPVSHHDGFTPNIDGIPALTIPSQELVTDSVAPSSDNSPHRPSHLAYLSPSSARPTGQPMSRVDLAPHFSPCSLTCPYPSIRMPPVEPSSPPAKHILHHGLLSISDRRVRGEPEDSSDENLRPFKTSENAGFVITLENATGRIWSIGYLSDFFSFHFDVSPLNLAKEHELYGSGGFSSHTTRTALALSSWVINDNKSSFRSFRARPTAPEPEPYSSSRLSSKIIPPLPLRRTRSSRRMVWISAPNSPQVVPPMPPVTIFHFYTWTPNFFRRLLYSQGTWHIIQNASAVLLPSPGVPTSLLLLDFSVGASQGTVAPQRRWTPADEVDIRRYVQEAGPQLPVFLVNRNGSVGCYLPDIIKGRDHDLLNRDNQAQLGGGTMTHISINVSPTSYLPPKDFHTCSPTPLTVARIRLLATPDANTRRDIFAEPDHSRSTHGAYRRRHP